jgi:methyl-accepting chemotaxis protein
MKNTTKREDVAIHIAEQSNDVIDRLLEIIERLDSELSDALEKVEDLQQEVKNGTT